VFWLCWGGYSCVGENLLEVPAFAGMTGNLLEVPAFAGMTLVRWDDRALLGWRCLAGIMLPCWHEKFWRIEICRQILLF